MRNRRAVGWLMFLSFLIGTSTGSIAGQIPTTSNLALNRPAQQSSRSQWSRADDPQGAVNGLKNGGFGFHTNQEPNPWWQVDLGARHALGEVRIFNRLDCCRERARTIAVLLSDDGRVWRTAYRHDGSIFGSNDGYPLIVPLRGEPARYVRLQLAENNWFHLDEVEIYGAVPGTPIKPVAEQVRYCALALLSTLPTAGEFLAEYRRQASQTNIVPEILTEEAVEEWLRQACIVRCRRELGVSDEID